MKYYLTKEIRFSFEEAKAKITSALKTEGFGILTEIDVKQTLKSKIGVDFPKYSILGACNPGLAHRALKAEEHVGAMLPCNVVVREIGEGMTEVFAVDPLASMSGIENDELKIIAQEVKEKLERVIRGI